MIALDSKTVALLADRLAPRIAERLVAQPQPGLVSADPEELVTETVAAAILGMQPSTLCAWRRRVAETEGQIKPKPVWVCTQRH